MPICQRQTWPDLLLFPSYRSGWPTINAGHKVSALAPIKGDLIGKMLSVECVQKRGVTWECLSAGALRYLIRQAALRDALLIRHRATAMRN